MARHLAELDVDVDLLVYPIGENVELPNNVRLLRSVGIPGISSVPIGPSWRKAVLDLGLAWSAFVLAIRNRYQVFHGVEEGGIIACVLASLFRRKFVYDMDSCMTDQLKCSRSKACSIVAPIINRLERWCIRRADAVLTVCEDLTLRARLLGAKTEDVYQIEDFAPDDLLKCDETLLKQWRQTLSPCGERIVLYTGNLASYQGVDLLLEAFGLAQFESADAGAPHVPVYLVIVGGAAPELIELRNRLKQLGIDERVKLVGEQSPDQMGVFLRLADVLVSPRIEGTNTPLKIYGYMASGKPIVATGIRSHTQVLDDTTATLVKPDPQSFADGLMKCLSPQFAAKASMLSETARQRAAAEHSEAEFATQLHSLYRNILQLAPAHTEPRISVTSDFGSDDTSQSAAVAGRKP